MLQTKIFEIRDRHTFIPVLATKMAPSVIRHSENEQYLLRRLHFKPEHTFIQLVWVGAKKTSCYSYDWNDRTMENAHRYIEENFDELVSGQVIDVEYILGEVTEPCQSERLDDF